MDSIVSAGIGLLGGGGDDSAQQAQIAQNAAAQKFLEEQTAIARGDIENIFPVANQNLLHGFASASDILKGLAPFQLNAQQSGNLAAQQALLTGMPMFENTILGIPDTTPKQMPVLNAVNPQNFADMLSGLPGPTTRPTSAGDALSGGGDGSAGFVTDVRDATDSEGDEDDGKKSKNGFDVRRFIADWQESNRNFGHQSEAMERIPDLILAQYDRGREFSLEDAVEALIEQDVNPKLNFSGADLIHQIRASGGRLNQAGIDPEIWGAPSKKKKKDEDREKQTPQPSKGSAGFITDAVKR